MNFWIRCFPPEPPAPLRYTDFQPGYQGHDLEVVQTQVSVRIPAFDGWQMLIVTVYGGQYFTRDFPCNAVLVVKEKPA